MTKRWLLMWYNGYEYEKHSYFDSRDEALEWLKVQGFTILEADYPSKDQFFTGDFNTGLRDSWAIVDTRVPPPEGPSSRIIKSTTPDSLGWAILLFIIVMILTGLLGR